MQGQACAGFEDAIAKLFGDVPFVDPDSFVFDDLETPSSDTMLTGRDVDVDFVRERGHALTFGPVEAAGSPLGAAPSEFVARAPQLPRGRHFQRQSRHQHGGAPRCDCQDLEFFVAGPPGRALLRRSSTTPTALAAKV